MIWSDEEKILLSTKTNPLETPKEAFKKSANEVKPVDTNTVTTPLEEIPVSFSQAERKALDNSTPDLTDNPRKIKRIINIYRFARLILPATQDRPKAINWFIMTEQWPLQMAWIIEYILNDQQINNRLKDKSIIEIYKLVKKHIFAPESEKLSNQIMLARRNLSNTLRKTFSQYKKLKIYFLIRSI